MKYELASDTWSADEIKAIQSVVDSNRYTMGPRVKDFENKFQEFFGVNYSVMINSGSSANLLAIASLFFNCPFSSIVFQTSSFAMVFFIFTLPLIYQNRKILYSLSIFVAMFFHKSVISIFPVVILSRYINSPISYSLTVILAIILSQVGLIQLLEHLFGIDFQFIPAVYFESNIGITDFLHKGILLIFCYLCVIKITKSDFDWFVLKLYSLAFPIYILFLEMPVMATRFYLFFRILEVVILSRTFENIRGVNNILIYLLLVLIIYLPGFYVQITHPDSALEF